MKALLLVGLIASSVEMASAQTAKPVGIWQSEAADGSVCTLSIGEKKLMWTFEMPEKGTSTLSAPRYHITEEGVLYGFISELRWTNGASQRGIKDLNPFAFRYSIENNKLVVKDLRLYGADKKAHEATMGTYHRKITSTAEKSETSRN